MLQRLKDILDIFVKATEHLSGSTYTTISTQLPYFSVLAGRLEAIVDQERLKIQSTCDDSTSSQPTSSSIFHDACNASWHKLNFYHTQTGSAQAIATILDPRCKIQSFRHLEWQQQWINEAEAAIQRIYQDQYAPIPISRPSTPPISSQCSDMEDDYMNTVFGNSEYSQVQLSMSEVDMYLEEKVELP